MLEMLESVVILIGGAVVAAPMLPGFTLCIPALIVLTVAILVPVLAAVALATLVGVVLAIPYLLVRSVRSVRSHRTALRLEPVSVLPRPERRKVLT